MQYKLIENCHVENVVLGKNFNLGMTRSFFMLSFDNVNNKIYFYFHYFLILLIFDTCHHLN